MQNEGRDGFTKSDVAFIKRNLHYTVEEFQQHFKPERRIDVIQNAIESVKSGNLRNVNMYLLWTKNESLAIKHAVEHYSGIDVIDYAMRYIPYRNRSSIHNAIMDYKAKLRKTYEIEYPVTSKTIVFDNISKCTKSEYEFFVELAHKVGPSAKIPRDTYNQSFSSSSGLLCVQAA